MFMNKKLIFFTIIGIFVGIFAYTSIKKTAPLQIENAPNWISLEQAQLEAKDSGKNILVDVFEVGCKFCRAMEREVYPDSTVRAVLDAGYIPVKVNGNSEEMILYNGEEVMSRAWAQGKGIFVFPGTLILNPEGEVIKSRTGFMSVDELRRFLYN